MNIPASVLDMFNKVEPILLKDEKGNPIQTWLRNKQEAKRIFDNFARLERKMTIHYGHTRYEIEYDNGKCLGLTYLAHYDVWEFYSIGFNKHDRTAMEFKIYLNGRGLIFKQV